MTATATTTATDAGGPPIRSPLTTGVVRECFRAVEPIRFAGRIPHWNPEKQSGLAVVLPAAMYLIAAVAMAIIAAATGTDSITEGLVLGLITGIGFALPIVGVEATFNPNKPKPLAWFLITVAYHLIGFAILAVTVAIL